MAFTYVGGATAGEDPTTSLTLTHGVAINDGDLAVVYANVNGPQTVSIGGGGAAWTEALNAEVSGETARHALWWKICNGSEPSSYSISLGGSDRVRAVIKVFRPGAGNTAVVDAALNATGQSSSPLTDIICEAVDGEVISNNAVSIACGGKDNQAPSDEPYTQANNSYIDVLGNKNSQATAVGHRIFTTGTTFSGNVTFETNDGNDGINDRSYGAHISFVEQAAASDDDTTIPGGAVSVSGAAPSVDNGSVLDPNTSSLVGGTVSVTGAGPVVDDGAPVSDHSYFNSLVSNGSHIYSNTFRSQAAIDFDRGPNKISEEPLRVPYDEVEDAARIDFSVNASNPRETIRVGEQHNDLPLVGSGNIFWCWEVKWDVGWELDANLGPMIQHKCFQLADRSNSDARNLEIRIEYDESDDTEVGTIDLRHYDGASGVDFPDQPINPNGTEFVIQGGVWTRFWTFFDFPNKQFSMWAADENRTPVQVFDRLQFASYTRDFDEFWFQFNSSQSRIGPALQNYIRNFVVLAQLPGGYSDAATLVSLGGDVLGGGGSNPPPDDDTSTVPGGTVSVSGLALVTDDGAFVVPDGGNAYYDFLAGQPEAQFAVPFRSEADVTNYLFGNPIPTQRPFYNSTLDAIEWTFADGQGSYFLGQLRTGEGSPNFGIGSGKVLIFWEARWSTGWGDYSNAAGQAAHKAFQLGHDGGGDDRAIEIQIRYGAGSTNQISLSQPEVAHVTLRTYGGNAEVSPSGQGINDFPPLSNFVIYPDRWVRFWAEVDFANTQFSFWVGDPIQGAVQMFDAYQFSSFPPEIDNFWWEWNSSTPRTSGPDLPVYGRNLVVLQNANADSLVSQSYAVVSSDNSSDVAVGGSVTVVGTGVTSDDGEVPTDNDSTLVGGAVNLAGTEPLTDDGAAAVYYVSATGNDSNTGLSTSDPFLTIGRVNSLSLNPGDAVLFRRGDSFSGTLTLDGEPDVTVASYGDFGFAAPVIEGLDILSGSNNATIGLITIDRQKAALDALRIRASTGVTISNVEIRNGQRDGIDASDADGLSIINCEIHHLLGGTFSVPIDSHGIAIGGTDGATITNTDIYQVSGDCLQVDPNRIPGNIANNIVINGGSWWTAPLTEDWSAGWQTDDVPGENALDTKVVQTNWEQEPRLTITVTDLTAYGFSAGPYIANRAAFNLKEKVDVTLNNVTVYDCEIAYRLRGSLGNANTTINGGSIYNCDKAFRAEDDLTDLVVDGVFFNNPITEYVEYITGSNAGTWTLTNNSFPTVVPAPFSDNLTNFSRSDTDVSTLPGGSVSVSGAAPLAVTPDFSAVPGGSVSVSGAAPSVRTNLPGPPTSLSVSGGDSPDDYTVLLFTDANSEFNIFTVNATDQTKTFMAKRFSRMQAYYPTAANFIAWFPDIWDYESLYSSDNDDAEFTTGANISQYILRDETDSFYTYVNFDCKGGDWTTDQLNQDQSTVGCAKFAMDPGAAGWRSFFIAQALADAPTAKGMWLDNVNLVRFNNEIPVGDGDGNWVRPLDPRTGLAMTNSDWNDYVIAFTQEVKTALGSKELCINPYWGSPRDQQLRNLVAIADYVNLERIFLAPAIDNGTGNFSLEAAFELCDLIHEEGTKLVVDTKNGGGSNPDMTEQQFLYSLAAYLIIKEDGDLYGIDDQDFMSPDPSINGQFNTKLNVALGAPIGPRVKNGNVYTRQYTNGSVQLDASDADNANWVGTITVN